MGRDLQRQITWNQVKDDYREHIEQILGPVVGVDEIIEEIYNRRVELGYTQKEVADRAGIKQPAIARLESFVNIPRLDTLMRVLKALGLRLRVERIEQSSEAATPKVSVGTLQTSQMPYIPENDENEISDQQLREIHQWQANENQQLAA